jgi:glutathione S-transferase
MLELHHWEPNTFFLKPLIALNEKQQPFTPCWFDADQLAQEEPSFPRSTEARLRQEPEGPVLVHNGVVICGSFFMLEYIAEALPGMPLHGGDALEQYRVRAWGQMLAGLAADVSLLGTMRHLAPALHRQDVAALRARIARLEPLERRRAWSALLADPDEAALAQASERLRIPVAHLEQTLAGSAWLAGPGYTIADIDAFALTGCLPSLLPEGVSPQSTPHLVGFLARMRARPAVQAALAVSRSGRPEEAFVPGPEPSRWG